MEQENIPSEELSFEERLIKEQEGKFKEGEPIKLLRVRFPGNSKSFPFMVDPKKSFSYGERVVAMSDRGMAVGYINSFPYEVPFEKVMLPLRTISRGATDEDLANERESYLKEVKARDKCNDLIDRHRLDMNLTHVEFTSYGKKAVFYFTAPSRVDFRNLVKDLVGELRMRVELRQFSVRDRSAAIGGIGPCGLQLCCSYFLQKYGSVSIKMAKNQNLNLTPTKLNGACGQLKCCIKYEDDIYSNIRNLLPKEGKFVRLKNGDTGKVLRLHLLPFQFELLTDKGAKRRYTGSEFDPKDFIPKDDWRFPTEFDYIVDETGTLIGKAVEPEFTKSLMPQTPESDED